MLWYCRREVEGRVRSCLVRLDSIGAPADVEEVKRIAAAELGGEPDHVKPFHAPMPGAARTLETGDGGPP